MREPVQVLRAFVGVVFCAFVCLPCTAQQVATQSESYHLTARPWKPLAIPRSQYLDVLEGLCRFSVKHQNASGAIVDPDLHRELQYSTPYFAYAVGTVVRADKAPELLASGVAAMEHSTKQFSEGRHGIPDNHGEFFIAALTESLEVYRPLVSAETWQRWHDRMRVPVGDIVGPLRNNWMTYSMKGEWLRAKVGLVSHDDAVSFIENAWLGSQKKQIAMTPFHLYHDHSSLPDTLSVEAVGRGNLLALVEDGYDGPSAREIREAAEDGTRNTLLLQDPTGQAPANGRTDDHVWVDVGYQLAFQTMASEAWTSGRKEEAAIYQHASELSFANIARWKRTDVAGEGAYYIAKNHFDPALRVGYQDASAVGNYTGSLMFHLAEAYNARSEDVPEAPAPAEIGGYAVELDHEFSSVLADAGGLQVQMNLRGQTQKSSGNWWTPLGIVRISRVGWDSRLGPSDGALTEAGGISFAPEFFDGKQWQRMASLANQYRATWKPEFMHPALVRGVLTYEPLPGRTGPVFAQRIWMTPDGIYSETKKTSSDPAPWGMTWPLLENDGRTLLASLANTSATTGYEKDGDEEAFLAVSAKAKVERDGPSLRSTYGDLIPVRVEAVDGVDQTFVYPHNFSEPSAKDVQTSFRRTADGFTSMLGSVSKDVYVGRTVAGGVSQDLVLPSGLKLHFNHECGFVVQLRNGAPIAIETDREVSTTFHGKSILLHAHEPKFL